ncbi:12060_t:CDS:2, partial [Dentiscutata heterogama]
KGFPVALIELRGAKLKFLQLNEQKVGHLQLTQNVDPGVNKQTHHIIVQHRDKQHNMKVVDKPNNKRDRILADVEIKEGAGYKEALQNSLIVKKAATHSVASVSSNPKAKLVDEKLHESS